MREKRKTHLFVLLLIMLVALAGGITFVINKYVPSKQQMDLNLYYGGLSQGEAALVLETEILEERGLHEGETWYLPLSVVNSCLNQRYFWDEKESQILYATPSELVRVPAEAAGGGSVYLKNGTVFLSLPFVQQFTDVDLVTGMGPDRIAMRNDFSEKQVVTVEKGTALRYESGIKSDVLIYVAPGDVLLLMEDLEGWYKAASRDGFIGYVQKKAVSAPAIQSQDRPQVREEYSHFTREDPVVLVWHNMDINYPEGNGYLTDYTRNMSGVNVISPTWMRLHEDNSGNLISIVSSDYVEKAHQMGLQVWGLVDNFGACSTLSIISSTDTRQRLVQNLIAEALSCGMDGINVDFESLSEEAGNYFLEFLRELSIETHKNHLVLSVDNPVPQSYTSHYDRKEQGEVVDYVIIMGYDEHGNWEPQNPGSLASLPWVEQGIVDTIAEAPAERVINAIPFYTAVWMMSGSMGMENVSMARQNEMVKEYKAEIYWDKTVSQNVATYERDGQDYKIWMEDNASIAEKVKLVPKYDLAGLACWRLGQEDNSIWQTIAENLRRG